MLYAFKTKQEMKYKYIEKIIMKITKDIHLKNIKSTFFPILLLIYLIDIFFSNFFTINNKLFTGDYYFLK